jgi:hypothetical protein
VWQAPSGRLSQSKKSCRSCQKDFLAFYHLSQSGNRIAIKDEQAAISGLTSLTRHCGSLSAVINRSMVNKETASVKQNFTISTTSPFLRHKKTIVSVSNGSDLVQSRLCHGPQHKPSDVLV